MNSSGLSHQSGNANNTANDLEQKKENLEKLEREYLFTQELAKEKQKKVQAFFPQYEKVNEKISDLVTYRDNLNTAIRRQRTEVKEADKAVREAEAYLEDSKSQLTKYENAVIEARKNVNRAKRDAKPFLNQWQLAQTEWLEAKKKLVDAFEKVKAAQQEYRLAGGKLTSEEKAIPSPETITKEAQNNPWLSGSFYLFVSMVIIGVIVLLIYFSIPWYAIVAAVTLAIFWLIVIAALQLRNDKNLSEENFTTLLLEVVKRLPLIKKT